MPEITFPDRFVWGTATAAHQIEGGNVNNDWWVFEHDPASGCADVSGDACDSFNRYADDIALVAELGLSAYRFSLEWSRIEPEEGEFSRVALDHYRRMAATCHEHGILPVVTFHHFTHPRWLAAAGTWESINAPDRFARYCERVHRPPGRPDREWPAPSTSPTWWPPWAGASGSSPRGSATGCAGTSSTTPWWRPTAKAVEAIRSGPGNAPVGLTLSMTDYQTAAGRRRSGWSGSGGRPRTSSWRPPGATTSSGSRPTPGCGSARTDPLPARRASPPPRWATSSGPRPSRPPSGGPRRRPGGLPVYVTENGIGTDDDAARIEYVGRALAGVRRCLDDGIDVRGYFYWSLLDNFEWVLGYGPTFGLVAVDRATFERHPKPSAAWFGGVARANGL